MKCIELLNRLGSLWYIEMGEKLCSQIKWLLKDPVKQKQTQHEARLLHYLITNYNKNVRPLLDHNGNITVHVGITLTQIFDMVSNKYDANT